MREEVYILLLLLSLLPSGLFYLKQERQKRICISLSAHVVLDTFNKNINDRKYDYLSAYLQGLIQSLRQILLVYPFYR